MQPAAITVPGIGTTDASSTMAAACIPSTGQPTSVPTPTESMPPVAAHDTHWLQTVCAAANAMRARAVPEADRIVHFDEILSGAVGPEEQQAALAMMQRADHEGKPTRLGNGATHAGTPLVYVDDGGMAPAAVYSSWRQISLHNMTVTVRSTSAGTKRKTAAVDDMAEETALRKRKSTKNVPTRKYGDCPGPMPAGWVVVRRDVEDPGRQYKRYKSPQGQMFASYGQAQQYWERVGSMVLLDAVPPVELIPASAAPAVADTTADGDISGDVPLDEAVGARAGEDGEVDVIQPLHNVGERKYLPSMYVGASSQASPGAWWSLDHVRQGQSIVHQPTGTLLKSVVAVRQSIKRRSLSLHHLPPSIDFGAMLDWFGELARSDAPQKHRGRPRKSMSPALPDGQDVGVLADGVERVQAVLTEGARKSAHP